MTSERKSIEHGDNARYSSDYGDKVSRLTETYLSELTKLAQEYRDAKAAQFALQGFKLVPGFPMREDGEHCTTEVLCNGRKGRKRISPFPVQTLIVVDAIRECLTHASFVGHDKRVEELIQVALAYLGRATYSRDGELFGHDPETWELLERADKALRKTRLVKDARGTEQEWTNLLFRRAAMVVCGIVQAHRQGPMYGFSNEGTPALEFRSHLKGARQDNERDFVPRYYVHVAMGTDALSRFKAPEIAIRHSLIELDPRFDKLSLETIQADLARLPADLSERPRRGKNQHSLVKMLADWFESCSIIEASSDPDNPTRKRIEIAVNKIPHWKALLQHNPHRLPAPWPPSE